MAGTTIILMGATLLLTALLGFSALVIDDVEPAPAALSLITDRRDFAPSEAMVDEISETGRGEECLRVSLLPQRASCRGSEDQSTAQRDKGSRKRRRSKYKCSSFNHLHRKVEENLEETATVKGRVDDIPETLPESVNLKVVALPHEENLEFKTTLIKGKDRAFCFKNLAKGTYDFELQDVCAFPLKIRNVAVTKEGPARELVFQVPYTGRCRFKLADFRAEDFRGEARERYYSNLALHLTSPEGEEQAWFIDTASPMTPTLPCGAWKADLHCYSLGWASLYFHVTQDITTEVTFFRADLAP